MPQNGLLSQGRRPMKENNPKVGISIQSPISKADFLLGIICTKLNHTIAYCGVIFSTLFHHLQLYPEVSKAQNKNAIIYGWYLLINR